MAEPFHLEACFDGKAPTVALMLGAAPVFAADHLMPSAGDGALIGKRQPARAMCREWHRAHVIIRTRTELRVQDLTRADLADLGHSDAASFARVWDVQINEWRRGMKWADNPTMLKFGFELVREALPREALGPLARDTPPAAKQAQPQPLSVEAAKAHGALHRQVRKISATSMDPVELAPRPVRTVAALRTLTPSLPTLAEREFGLCRRCGSRLAFGCEHHPLQETAA